MKIAIVSVAIFASLGIAFALYLQFVFQSENVQKSLFIWEKENRFVGCKKRNNISLTARTAITDTRKIEVGKELKQITENEYFQLGVKYIQNDGYMLDDDEAMSTGTYIFLVAAKLGDAAAMNEIGVSLTYCEQGVLQNLELAKSWFDESANKNDEYALYNLGVLHLQNIDPFTNKSKGLRFIRKSARLGHIDSREILVTMRIRIRLNGIEKLSLRLYNKNPKDHEIFNKEALEKILDEEFFQ